MTSYDGIELVVERRESAAVDVLVLTLRHPSGAELPAWEPGAHIDLVLGPGLERQYSLCGDPADRGRWRIAVLRERDGRGGSAHVHERVRPGDEVRARGPRNHFRLEPGAVVNSAYPDRDAIFEKGCHVGGTEGGQLQHPKTGHAENGRAPLALIGKSARVGSGVRIPGGAEIRPGKSLVTQEAANAEI